MFGFSNNAEHFAKQKHLHGQDAFARLTSQADEQMGFNTNALEMESAPAILGGALDHHNLDLERFDSNFSALDDSENINLSMHEGFEREVDLAHEPSFSATEEQPIKNFFATSMSADDGFMSQSSLSLDDSDATMSQAKDLADAFARAGLQTGELDMQQDGIEELIDEDDFFAGSFNPVSPDRVVDHNTYDAVTDLELAPAKDLELEAKRNAARATWDSTATELEVAFAIEELDAEESRALQAQQVEPNILSEEEQRKAEQYAERDLAQKRDLFSLVEDEDDDTDPLTLAANHADISFVALAEVDRVDISHQQFAQERDSQMVMLHEGEEQAQDVDEELELGNITQLSEESIAVSAVAAASKQRTGTDASSGDVVELPKRSNGESGLVYEENGRLIEVVTVMPEKETFGPSVSDFIKRDRDEGVKLLPSLLHDFGTNFIVYSLAICICVLCLAKVYQVQETRNVTTRLEEVKLQNSNLNREWLNLVAERQTLSEHVKIRSYATSKLNMVSPRTESEQVISLHTDIAR